MTMSPLYSCGKPYPIVFLLNEAPSSSQREQGSKRLIVRSLPLDAMNQIKMKGVVQRSAASKV